MVVAITPTSPLHSFKVPSGVKVKEESPQAEENVSGHLLMEHGDVVMVPSLNVTAAPFCPLSKALALTKEWTCKWNESHIMLQVGEFMRFSTTAMQ